MKTIRRKVIFAKRIHVRTNYIRGEIYGTYNLCITSVQYSKNIQNVQK